MEDGRKRKENETPRHEGTKEEKPKTFPATGH
jgi:hypothetical protein